MWFCKLYFTTQNCISWKCFYNHFALLFPFDPDTAVSPMPPFHCYIHNSTALPIWGMSSSYLCSRKATILPSFISLSLVVNSEFCDDPSTLFPCAGFGFFDDFGCFPTVTCGKVRSFQHPTSEIRTVRANETAPPPRAPWTATQTPGQRSGRGKIQCYSCGQLRHIAMKCPSNLLGQTAGQRSANSYFCTNKVAVPATEPRTKMEVIR